MVARKRSRRSKKKLSDNQLAKLVDKSLKNIAKEEAKNPRKHILKEIHTTYGIVPYSKLEKVLAKEEQLKDIKKYYKKRRKPKNSAYESESSEEESSEAESSEEEPFEEALHYEYEY